MKNQRQENKQVDQRTVPKQTKQADRPLLRLVETVSEPDPEEIKAKHEYDYKFNDAYRQAHNIIQSEAEQKEMLKKAWPRRVAYEKSRGFPPVMTEDEFINIWLSNPKKLARRNGKNGRWDGYQMQRKDFDSPLSVDNYQLIQKMYYRYIDTENYEQKIIKGKISKANKKPKAEAQKRKTSETMTGVPNTKAQNKAISIALTGGKNSEETISKKSAAATARWANHRAEKAKGGKK